MELTALQEQYLLSMFWCFYCSGEHQLSKLFFSSTLSLSCCFIFISSCEFYFGPYYLHYVLLLKFTGTNNYKKYYEMFFL